MVICYSSLRKLIQLQISIIFMCQCYVLYSDFYLFLYRSGFLVERKKCKIASSWIKKKKRQLFIEDMKHTQNPCKENEWQLSQSKTVQIRPQHYFGHWAQDWKVDSLQLLCTLHNTTGLAAPDLQLLDVVDASAIAIMKPLFLLLSIIRCKLSLNGPF